jgi:hypothetical protein
MRERSSECAKQGEMKVRYEANEVQTKPLPLQEQLGGMMGEKRNIATSWSGDGRTFKWWYRGCIYVKLCSVDGKWRCERCGNVRVDVVRSR